ncbi:lysine transporter LysE [Streptomyces sp. NPDC057412]|uniref:lysine transporter LysE n=1 Tax=Streptomyces sp. NPDC057412 TaxID=3346123 RepID=UPI0036C42AFA
MGVRKAAKGVGDFLAETAGEAVMEVLLSLLACAVLGCLVLTVYLSWSYSPRFTIAGVGLLSLVLAYGGWHAFRSPGKGRRRGLAALTAAGFTVAAVTALFLLLYGTGCDCL